MSGKAAAVIQTIMPAITTAMSGIFAGRQNKLQRQHEANMYAQAQKDNLANWNMQNEYNSPAQMMARLKAAGMNPNLAYGEFSAGRAEQPNYTPQQVSDQSQNLSRAMDFSQIGNVMSNIYDLKIKKGQADLLEAQASTQSTVQLLNTITAELKRLEQQKLQISNKYDQETLEKRIQMLSAQYDSILAGINEAKSRTRPYITRHGNGPIPTSKPVRKVEDPNNKFNEFQRTLRAVEFDVELLQHSLLVDSTFYPRHLLS